MLAQALAPFMAVYFLLFSAGLAFGLLWILERGENKYHLGANYSRPYFLWVSLLFIFSCLANFATYFRTFCQGPSLKFVYWQFCQLAGLLAFGWFKEKLYKDQLLQRQMKLSDEINRLKEVMAHDPANISCHERLSVLYEELGNWTEAELHAKAACSMDPSELNKWRVKTLRRDIEDTINKDK